MRQHVAALVAAGAALAPVAAGANTSEDIMGVSARTSALGGAATALPNDFTAAYYNPAALAHCREQSVGIDLRHNYYRLAVDRGAGATAEAAELPPNYTRLTMGLCIKLPLDLSLGAMMGLGVRELLTDAQSSSNSRPRFPLYGQAEEQMTLLLGLAWRPRPWISVGLGTSIFLDAFLPFSLAVPISMEDPDAPGQLAPLALDLDIHLRPKVAPYLGVMLEPRPDLRIGVSYREPLYASFVLPATVNAQLVGLDLLIPVMVEALAWYSPRQAAIGASGEPVADVTLTGDVTWYGYEVLNGTPYPFLSVTPTEDNAGGITGQIGFPRIEHDEWKDAWALRGGAEARLLDDRVALRAGYAVKTSSLEVPAASSNVNLLDSSLHSFTVGAGYAPRGRMQRSPSPTAALQASVAFDAFFRASVMPQQRADAKDFTYGGQILDIGMQMSLGW